MSAHRPLVRPLPLRLPPSIQTAALCLLIVLLLTPSVILAAPPPVRIGATVSLEGPYRELSLMVRKGYELWAVEVNRRGGLLGRKVELVFYDDKSRVDRVRTLYEQLITEDKVDLVLSPYGSSLTLAAAEVTDSHGYTMLACTASATTIWQQGFRHVFGIYATADRYLIGFVDLIARKGLRSIGIIYHNSPFNIDAANGTRTWANRFGLKVNYSAAFGRQGEDLHAIVRAVQQSDIDGLVFCGYPPDGYRFIELLKKEKYRPKALAMTILPALSSFYTKAGPFAENIFGPSQWEADERLPFPGTERFIRKFNEVNGSPPSYHACSAYSSCQILEKAINYHQKIDQAMIRDYVASLDTVTIMGRFKVDHRGSQVGHNAILIQWQNGKKEIVYPAKMRTAPPRFQPAG